MAKKDQSLTYLKLHIVKTNPCPLFKVSEIHSAFSHIYFSEINAKFHVKPSGVGAMKICSDDLGHMTKMPIYSKKSI